MPPPASSSNFIISKLGVQATARDDTVTGLICLKVSIPREGEGRQVSRYSLFTGNNPPKLLSPPEVYPLPYTATPTPGVRTASRLLGLGTSYPPSPAVSGFKPVIDVSSTTGQVFLVLDPRRSSPSKRDSPGGGRRDWLIVLHVGVGVERCIERGSQQILLGLPKCLDNVIRFQILAPVSSSSASAISDVGGDISIIAEPRVLPVAPDTFAVSSLKNRNRAARHGRQPRSVGVDEDWEDGEDMGPEEDYESEESEGAGASDEGSGDEEGSWLEGRFPSTETLRLEWSFGGASTSSSLLITPTYDPRAPTIHVAYEAAIRDVDIMVPVEAVLPDGWGWREVSIRGEGLLSWRSIDGDWWDEPLEPAPQALLDRSADMSAMDDSFSTIRQRRTVTPLPGQSTPTGLGNPAASLLRQTLPSMGKMEEYSFEMSNTSIETAKPTTPTPTSMSTPKAGSRRSTPSPAHLGTTGPVPAPRQADAHNRRPLRGPAPAKLFDVEYDEDAEGGTLIFEGTLVPISRTTLVSTGLPLLMPLVRIERADDAEELCEVECRGRIEGQAGEVDLGQGNAGHFRWTDAEGRPSPDERARLDGDVDVRMVRDVWGGVTARISFGWPKRAREVGWAVPGTGVRITRTTQRGVSLPWATSEVGGQTEIRLGRSERGDGGGASGPIEVSFETRMDGGVVPVPRCEGDGMMRLHLNGEWGIDQGQFRTNMSRVEPDSLVFTYDLSSTTSPTFAIATSGLGAVSRSQTTSTRARGLLSWTTLAALFMLYLIMSLAQRVERFRAEVSFVANEIKDLRKYGVGDVAAQESAMALASAASAAAAAASASVAASATSSVSHMADQNAAASDEGGERNPGSDISPVRADANRPGAEMSTSLGRVVFGRTAWDRWAAHPTMQTLGRGISWVWHAVVWLVIAPP